MFRDDCQPWLTKQGLQLTSFIKGDAMFKELCKAKGLSDDEIEELTKKLNDVWSRKEPDRPK